MAQPHVPAFLSYQSIPTLKQWQRDRGGLSAVKGKPDRILERIDVLVKSLGPSKKKNASYNLCELYFSTNYWIRNVGPTLQQKQDAAPVAALFDCVKTRLASLFKCPGLMVAAKLQQHYCCNENAHGIFCDEYDIPHSFQNRGETEKFKLYFVNGLAMWNPWWEQISSGLVNVNTAKAREMPGQSGTGSLRPGACFFVMNRYRDLYAAPHFTRNPDYPMYHSSIPKGQGVQFAGSIVIEDGVIKEICNDSGHYKPEKEYVLNVLEHLKTVGAKSFNGIEVCDFEEGPLFTADVMLKELKNGGWKGIVDRAKTQRGVTSGMTAAIKGRERGKRLKELAVGMGRDKALEKICAEQFDIVRGGKPVTFGLWKDTCLDVVKSMIAFYGGHKMPDFDELAEWLNKKKEEYERRPPVPPQPSSKPPAGTKPAFTSSQHS
jgi:hypothetical protein